MIQYWLDCYRGIHATEQREMIVTVMDREATYLKCRVGLCMVGARLSNGSIIILNPGGTNEDVVHVKEAVGLHTFSIGGN